MPASTEYPALDQPLLFISDVHLGGFSEKENEQIESELIELIDYCQQNKIHIAILGDLFDYWMEYPNHVPNIGAKLLDRFEQFNRQLGPSLYITGNHDNWTREHLQKRGFNLLHEQITFSENNLKIMALHGDGLADPNFNLSRPLLHRILRKKYFIKIFQALFPPSAGITIMKYFSRFTRRIDEGAQKADKLNRWARKELQNSDTDIILCGHDHLPRQKEFSFGTYINLGTFYQHQTMALYNNNDISLVSWRSREQAFKQFENSRLTNE